MSGLVTIDDLKVARKECDLALDTLRKIVHKICKLSGADNTCPYMEMVRKGDLSQCKNCQWSKSNGRT